MKRKNVILSLVASISVLILVVGLFAVKQFMQWRMLLNSGVFSAAHKDIMEGLLGHIYMGHYSIGLFFVNNTVFMLVVVA
mgnify:CR=1 FL=1